MVDTEFYTTELVKPISEASTKGSFLPLVPVFSLIPEGDEIVMSLNDHLIHDPFLMEPFDGVGPR